MRCLRARRHSLRRGGWHDCNLPRNTSSIGYAGLKQLGDRILIFIRRFNPSNRLLCAWTRLLRNVGREGKTGRISAIPNVFWLPCWLTLSA
jgi:hypothetical protein